MLVPLRGDCDCSLLCCLLFVRFPRSNTGKLQIGGCVHVKHHVAHNAVAYTMKTPVPARTIRTNNKMGAEPPSLYDGTSSVTQNKGSRTAVPIRRNVNVHSNRKAQHSQLFQHLFLVREHRPQCSHNRERSKQGAMFTMLTQHTQQIECDVNNETLQSSTPQTRTRCTPAYATGALVTICRTALRIRSPPFQLRSLKQSQTNSKCSRSCAKHVPHNNARAKPPQVFFTANDALPKFFFNQSPVLFLRPRVAHTEWCRPVIYNSRPRSSDARLS